MDSNLTIGAEVWVDYQGRRYGNYIGAGIFAGMRKDAVDSFEHLNGQPHCWVDLADETALFPADCVRPITKEDNERKEQQ